MWRLQPSGGLAVLDPDRFVLTKRTVCGWDDGGGGGGGAPARP